ncbi:hypothetical protein DYB32_001442 [Aphanomyces invadans]|uniref:Prolyl 4-hydroxylase alpha subunit domain-containing protein n=1 Tax=Aphanomyces invadans TaxID=157072 RepID=A0A3R6YET8_9STRA|nr:hypothetical protein DYB32_001442 [Aphanomyces invadans]
MWVSWGDQDSTAKRDLSMCSQALASFGAKAFGNHGVDVDHATLYDQMGNALAGQPWDAVVTATRVHVLLDQEVWVLARLPARDYIEDIQLVRYEAGQMYKAHTDYFTHVDVADELNHPASKSFSHWIQWVQQLNVIPPSHPLYPTHTNEFELQLASLLLQPNSFVNDALWTYIPPEWKAWMEKHVALQSDYIISSMVAAFQPVNPVVPLSFIRQRWEEVVGVPAAVFRFPLLAKYIEPNRHATLFVYLNNVGDGGETVFPMHPGFDTPINTTSAQDMPECSRGLAVRPQQGSGVLFYSKHPSGENDYRSLHGGCPPAKGSIKWGSNLFMWNVPAERGQRLWKLCPVNILASCHIAISTDPMSFLTTFDSSKTTRIQATSAQVFNVLKRVEHWPVWDVDLKKVILDTPTSTPLNNTKGTLFMKNYGGGEHPFAIQNVDESRHFEYFTRLPGADSVWYWTWSEDTKDGFVDMKMGVRVHGSAALLWRGALAPFLGGAFDKCLKNLKTLAEHGQVDGKDFSHLYH